jgi:hypothetical protein
MKSETCFAEMLGQYLPSQVVENNVLNTIEHEINNQNTDFSSYEFYKYDLPNQIRVTQGKRCDRCTGGDREINQGYLTKHEAHNTAEIIREEEGKYLRVYKCKYGGWHLTKRF